MAGWSGGRKVIAPGVAHAETITTFHNRAFMADPRAANACSTATRCTRSSSRSCAMLGGALALNTVIDDRRDLAFVNFGEIVESHLQAVEFVAAATRRCRSAARFRTVVTQRGRLPARQDLLPDRQGHGGAARHPGAGRRL